MRILHLVHQYLPEHVGGTELYTQQLAQHQHRQGHDVSVFYPSVVKSRKLSVDYDDGVRVYRVGVGKRSRRRVFLDSYGQDTLQDALITFLHAIDIVHVQHLMGLPLSLIHAIRQAGIPYVLTLHDYWHVCANAQLITNYDQSICDGPDSLHLNCARCLLARAGIGDRRRMARLVAPLLRSRARALQPVWDHAARVIAPTSFVRETYRQNGFDGAHVTVIPHGIEIPLNLPDGGRREDGFHIVYVGSIAWQKGVHILVDAFDRLPRNGFKLTIAGDLDLFPEYSARLRAASNHPGIRYAGRLDRPAVWALLASADVVVMPTLWYEASPLTIDEFFAAGVPVVGSAIGAVSEKIRDGVDGVQTPPGDVDALYAQLLELANDPARLAALRAGIGAVRTIEQHVSDIESLYAQILQTV